MSSTLGNAALAPQMPAAPGLAVSCVTPVSGITTGTTGTNTVARGT